MEEQWIPIKGYETIYLVSNLGRIKSLDKEVNVRFNCKAIKKSKIIQTNSLRKGYKYVQLYDLKSNYKKFYLHRLIAIHFIPNPNNYPQINHIDGNTLNNSIDNLEWCTLSENLKHAWRTGLNKPYKRIKGIKGVRGKLKNPIYDSPDKYHMAKKVICLKTGKVYGTIKEAAS